jgi:FMN phosphatase YigB (HAD superfamily)
MSIDLVCWDFGDTLVDETFMRIAPDGVPQWAAIYGEVLAERDEWKTEWDLGRATIHELIEPLADRLPMTPAAVSRHLRTVWQQIVWFPIARHWVVRLDGLVSQAVVTVNPVEFSGISTACGLDPLVDVIVTSADLATLSKVPMAERARSLLGLAPGLSTTLLIDNKAPNVDEFVAAGGQGYLFTESGFTRDAPDLFGSLF